MKIALHRSALTNTYVVRYDVSMNDVQEKLAQLEEKGWTQAAIADELEVSINGVQKWKSGDRYPANTKSVMMSLDALLRRKRIPKRRRYEGTHHLQRKANDSND